MSPGGGNGNQTEATLLGDLLADVWKSGDTFVQHNETDQRTISTNNTVLSTAYSDLNRSRGFYRDAIAAIRAGGAGQVRRDRRAVFRVGILGDAAWPSCSATAFRSARRSTDSSRYTTPLTNNEVYAIALAHLDSAIAAAVPVAGNLRADTLLATSIKNAASIAKGRVLVDLGRYSDAAAAVAGVPTSYTYNVTFSQATNDNNVWGLAGQVSTRARFVVGDSFDTQGITEERAAVFVGEGSARADGRSRRTANGTKSIDGITPLVSQQIWLNRSDPIPVATGIDARLIEAEAKLNANDIAGMMTILNALRTAPQTLGPLSITALGALPGPAPATKDAATSVFFREKAFWQFGRGMRLGDLRRLIRQYGRTEDQVFPSGKFHKAGGASYGTDVNLPVTDNERTNTNFTGCIDRKA